MHKETAVQESTKQKQNLSLSKLMCAFLDI